jgi:serine protease
MGSRWVWLAVGASAIGGWHGLQTMPVAAQSPTLTYELRLSADEIVRVRDAWDANLPYVPGEILVKFREGSTDAARLRAVNAIGAAALSRPVAVPDSILKIITPESADYAQALRQLQGDAEVEWAQPNYLRPLRMTPNDPGYARQWNLDLIRMPRGWEISDGGSETVVVAVIDSGVTTVTETHAFKLWTGAAFETVDIPFRLNPDLSGARVLAGHDFVFWDGPVVDMVGHGSHVAGTIAQETNNELGLAGIAYRVRVLPLKACYGYWEIQLALSNRGVPGTVRPSETGGCPDEAVASALRYAADNGAAVANLSLGSSEPSPILLDALTYAVSRGVFVAIAAGNEHDEGNRPAYPARYAETIEGVMTVGAVGRSSARATYSNTGSYIEVAAPGGDSGADGAAGLIYQASPFESDFDPLRIRRPRFDRYAETGMQGTSMAAPHVAGVAALLVSRGTTQPDAIEREIRKFARDLGRAGRDDEFGHGLLDVPATLLGNGVGVAR